MSRLFPLIAGAGLVVAAGCAGAGTPVADPVPVPQSVTRDPNASLLLGVYDLRLNPAQGVVELTPLRGSQALGDNFDVDITGFSKETLLVTGFSFPDLSTLRVDFEWTHPLPNTATRKDLHVFDVRLHILSDAVAQTYGGANGVTAPTGAGGADEVVAQADVPMANADGWSSWADEVVEPVLGDSDPSIYPFKLVHMDSGRGTVTPDSPAGWNVAPMSTTPYSVGVNFNLADGSEVNLRAALDASYGASAMKSIANPGVGSRLNPRYLNPEFNLKEPYFVSVDIVGTPQLGNPTTAATLTLTALDHQGPLAASGAFDPLTAPPTSLRYASALKEAVIAHPGLGTAVTVGSASFTGDGTPADPYIATVDLAGDSFTTPGTAVGLIAFRDQMLDSAGTGSPLPTQGYGRDLAVAARNDFATYLPFTLTVDPAGPPTWTQVHNMIVNGDPSVAGDATCVSCHVAGPNGLFMTADKNATYANLVNVASTCGEDYIEPNNPGASFLYEKLQPSPACGLQMPQSGPPYWSATAIQMVADWINTGAPNN